MTQGHNFQGSAVAVPSPEGGECVVALGKLWRTEGSEPEPAVFIQVTDKDGGEVAKFGLTLGSFGALMEAMMTAFQSIPTPKDIPDAR